MVLLVFLLVCSGCIRARDLADPLDRPIANTAYTTPRVQFDTSVGGSAQSDLVARVGVTAGLGKRVHLDANVAHLAFGVVNVGGRIQVIDAPRFSLAADLGVFAARPGWMWYLPPEVREPLQDVTLVNIPVGITGTTRVGSRVLLGLSGGYEHAQIAGEVDTESVVFDGALGARRIWFRPTVHLLLGRFLVQGSAFFPVAAWGYLDADARVTVSPGVRAGLVSEEWTPIPTGRGYAWQLTSEVRLNNFRVRFGVASNPVIRDFAVPLTPYLGLRWTP